jgi:peroxiredoxin
MSKIKIGDKLQDFRLRDKEEKEVHITSLARKYFYPSIRLPGRMCAEQMKSLEKTTKHSPA